MQQTYIIYSTLTCKAATAFPHDWNASRELDILLCVNRTIFVWVAPGVVYISPECALTTLLLCSYYSVISGGSYSVMGAAYLCEN